MFHTPYNRPVTTPEPGGGKSHVETAGYRSPKRQIEDLLMAGERLKAHRQDMYDFADEKSIDENLFDPTRVKGFDLADASQLQHRVAKAKLVRDQAVKASQTALDGSDKAPSLIDDVIDPEDRKAYEKSLEPSKS